MEAIAALLALIVVAGGDAERVVAVLDIKDARRAEDALDDLALSGMTDYFASKLTRDGVFEVVPRDDVRAALAAKKADSYAVCYDESCAIEIGKEVAAEKSVLTTINRVGSECVVTSTLFDLAKATAEKSASYRGGCGESELLSALETIARRLVTPLPELRVASGRIPTPDVPAEFPQSVRPVADTDAGGVLTSWWLWTIVGFVVVGGATAAIVVASTRGKSEYVFRP